ncbi:uncharacterized [Tachysurus ichikawai]
MRLHRALSQWLLYFYNLSRSSNYQPNISLNDTKLKFDPSEFGLSTITAWSISFTSGVLYCTCSESQGLLHIVLNSARELVRSSTTLSHLLLWNISQSYQTSSRLQPADPHRLRIKHKPTGLPSFNNITLKRDDLRTRHLSNKTFGRSEMNRTECEEETKRTECEEETKRTECEEEMKRTECEEETKRTECEEEMKRTE